MNYKSIIDRLYHHNYEPHQKWSTRYDNSTKKKLSQEMRKVISLLAGGEDEIQNFMNDVFTNEDKETFNKKYLNTLKNLATEYMETKKKQRHKILKCLKNGQISYTEANRLGFKCSYDLWRYSSLEKKKPGRAPLEEEIKDAIKQHMTMLSQESPYRTIVSKTRNEFGEKQIVTVRHRQVTYLEAYSMFPQRDKIKYSTFCRKIGPEFKSFLRSTDLCNYCEHAKELRPQLKEFKNKYKYPVDLDNFDYDHLLNFFNDNLEINEK